MCVGVGQLNNSFTKESEESSSTRSCLSTLQAHHMEDCCDTCGDIGVADALHTCSQCKIICRHMYCMRIILEEPVDDWVCEECEDRSKPKPLASSLHEELSGVSKFINSLEVRKDCDPCAESRKLPNDSRVASAKWEKMVATGKTKYISVKEALMLPTGEKKFSAPSNFTCHSKPPQPKIGIDKSDRTIVRPRFVPLSFSSQQDLASGPSRQPKPQRLGTMETCERPLQQSNKFTEPLRAVSSLQSSQAPKSKYMQKEQPRDIQWAQTKTRRLVKKQSSTPSLNASPVTIAGKSGNGHTTTELRNEDAENMNNNVLRDSEKCLCIPASDALWKGNFSIPDNHGHGKLNHQIEAHPPSRVRRKVYEFSKQMPEVLRFQLVPSKTFWINLFKEYTPDERDIALYFFPTVGERSEDYISLLEKISRNDFALREQIADVELLVFTSKLLPINSQCWKGKYFLWGVFHRLKRDTTACSCNRVLDLYVQPSDDARHAHNQVDNNEVVDMEIDSIGGINVGRVDIPVQREPSGAKRTSFREESAAATVLPGSHHKITAVAKRTFVSATTVLSLNVKKELDLIPPGYEELAKLRMQGSSSSMVNNGGREGQEREPNGDRSFPGESKSKYVRLA